MDELRCLFNAELVETDAGHAVEVPDSEVETGHLEVGDMYRVALVGGERPAADEAAPSEPQPPVEEGELRYVEVEDIGDQGDGIARVERGYVIILPGADVGDRMKVEIEEVEQNFAVGSVVEEEF